jgi:DNA-binding NarL/FixJ family response regulator
MRHDALPALLLLEPYFVLRHTVAAVARELRIADIVEATSLESATQMLGHRSFDACLVSVGDDRLELGLIQRLRDGALACHPETPVAVAAATVDAGLVLALKEMHVSRIVLKPFKVKVMLDTLTKLVADRPSLPVA